MSKLFSTYNFRFLLCLFLTTFSLQFNAQESGRINRSDWEDVTNGKDYFEKSSDKKNQQNDFQDGEKKHKRAKSESDRGYDPAYPERDLEWEENEGFSIPEWVSYFLIGLVMLALVAFIIYSTSDVKRNSRVSENSLDEEKLQEIEENPFDNDLERLIHEALEGKDYKLAVRLQFVYVVRLLSENGLITWKKHKTNSAYSRELKKHAFSSKYNQLNLLFEHVWYGDWELSSQVLSEINGSFSDSIKHLKNLKIS